MKPTAECCPPFNPELWDNKTLHWDNRKFAKSSVCTFFYMPLNFGGVITKLMKAADNANVQVPDYLCLSDHTSKWNMDIYLAIDADILGYETVSLSGNYYSKVYEGHFKDTGKWCADFDEAVKAQNLTYTKMYMWYTTCPKCAKKYGKNYVVVVAKLD